MPRISNEDLERLVARTAAEYIRPLIPAPHNRRVGGYEQFYVSCRTDLFYRDLLAAGPFVEQMAETLMRQIWVHRIGKFVTPYREGGYFHEVDGLVLNAWARDGGGGVLTLRFFGVRV